MRSLIIDDEAGARLRLRRLLQAQDCVEIVGEAEDGMAAVGEIERLRPDLLFLDIQMPGLDGFSVLKALPHDFPLPLVIFITGFHEHAMKAFEAKALAYLLKPIETDRLNEMVDRAWRLHRSADDRSQDDLKVKTLVKEATRRLERIVARKLDKYWLVNPSDVLFFQMDNGIVRAKTASETFWVSYQLGELEEALSETGFFRAHRSTLVNLKRVKEIRPDVRSRYVLVVADADRTEIEVSERQGRSLRERIPGL
jgi:DNA-binding LytR/AlgR family response regulator